MTSQTSHSPKGDHMELPEISLDAQCYCNRYFLDITNKVTLKNPKELTERARNTFDELVNAGLITRDYNRQGQVVFQGTTSSYVAGKAYGEAVTSEDLTFMMYQSDDTAQQLGKAA